MYPACLHLILFKSSVWTDQPVCFCRALNLRRPDLFQVFAPVRAAEAASSGAAAAAAPAVPHLTELHSCNETLFTCFTHNFLIGSVLFNKQWNMKIKLKKSKQSKTKSIKQLK